MTDDRDTQPPEPPDSSEAAFVRLERKVDCLTEAVAVLTDVVRKAFQAEMEVPILRKRIEDLEIITRKHERLLRDTDPCPSVHPSDGE